MPRIIKKYANRRLYDTETAAYVNLEQLTELIREGHEVQVVDQKSGEDLTREVLLQVLLEAMKGADLLPAGMLRRLIRATANDPLSLLIRQQIATGMQLMSAQIDQVESMFSPPKPAKPKPPPESDPRPQPKTPGATGPTAPPPAKPDEELDALRQRLEELEARLRR